MVSRTVTARWFAMLLTAVTVAAPLCAQESSPPDAPSEAAVIPLVVAAEFAGQQITIADVARIMAVLYRGVTYTTDQLPRLQAQALELAIDQRLVQLYVERATGSVDEAQVDALLENQQRELEKRGVTFAEYLRQAGTTEEDLRRMHAWSLGWNNYLKRIVTDDTVADYFERNRAEYDGTAVRVRHILLRVGGSGRVDKVESAQSQAADLRRQIVDAEIDFEDAARKYSAGPSRRHGGDLGFITRHGQMAEPFAAAAFRLKPDEISPPVVTSYGVHLIQCVEIRPGDFDLRTADERQREQMLRQLRAALTAETYKKIAALQRDVFEIQFTGDFPHFKPGTQELAQPEP